VTTSWCVVDLTTGKETINTRDRRREKYTNWEAVSIRHRDEMYSCGEPIYQWQINRIFVSAFYLTSKHRVGHKTGMEGGRSSEAVRVELTGGRV